MKTVALITMHNVVNYGSLYQTIATEKIIENLGFVPMIIDYVPKTRKRSTFYFNFLLEKDLRGAIRVLCSDLCYFPYRFKRSIVFNKIQRNYFRLSRRYNNYNELKYDPPQADVYLTGSDQVWSFVTNSGCDKAYYLKFIKGRKKIALSASIGIPELEPEQKDVFREMIKDYQFISVREQTAIEIVQSCGRNDAIWTLDPTMMLTAEQWNDLFSLDDVAIPKEKFVLVYILGREKRVMKYACILAERLGIPIVKVGGDLIHGGKDCIDMTCACPVTLMALFRNAEFVVSNSFHGTALSIEFGRQFITTSVANNARFDSILKCFDLLSRFFIDDFNIDQALERIDYSSVNQTLEMMRKTSNNYIRETLGFVCYGKK